MRAQLVQASKTEALQKLALCIRMPHEARESACGARLDVSYFMRHDANDIAWHARVSYLGMSLSRRSHPPKRTLLNQ